MSDSDDEPQCKLYTVKSKGNKKSRKIFQDDEDLTLVPPHILKIMQQVEDKKKRRKQETEDKKPDSTMILRNMMGMMRNKVCLDEAGQEERAERENDTAKISNARDIFKQKEAMEKMPEEQKLGKPEKHKRVDVNVDFMNEGRNRAEELRQARLREMAAMKSARESAMDEEEMWNSKNKQKSDEIKKQRELEIDMMRMARQQALDEEEREIAQQRNQPQRAISPGLAAAKNVSVKADFLEEKDKKVVNMRLEREREIKEMKRAREMELMMEEEEEGARDM